MHSQHLTQAHLYGLIGLGGSFWVVGVLTIRYTGHILFANNVRRLSSYIASIPISYFTLFFSEGLLGISSKQRLVSMVVMSVTALLMDGAALMWFPTLYENPLQKKKNLQLATTLSRMSAAWLLWTFGVGLGIALVA